MARRKGQTMTEEQKAAMRAKRLANKQGKQNAFNLVATNLKHLSFSELTSVIGLAQHERKNKLGDEELKLIKEKEEIEQRLQKLKKLDKNVNL